MEADRLGAAVEPGTDRLIGTRYGCLRCRYAFSVIGGRAALVGDRARDLVSHIERSAEAAAAHRSPPKDEIPMQRDVDMPWDRGARR